jgi:hypothetical protein
VTARDAPPAASPGVDERLQAWLAERGIDEPRRVARATSSTLVVSKVDDGFFERLSVTLERVAGLFEPATHAAAYGLVTTARPGLPRAEAWRVGVEGILRDAEAAGFVDAAQRAEIMGGIDSVSAIVDALMWSAPPAGEAWTPSDADKSAFRQLLDDFDHGSPLFTRHYGDFEGRQVVNRCPGGGFARRFVRLAWATCTGEEGI